MFDALDPTIEWGRAAIVERRGKADPKYERWLELRGFYNRCLNHIRNPVRFFDRCRKKPNGHRATEHLIARDLGRVSRCPNLSLVAMRVRLLQRSMLGCVGSRHGRSAVRDTHCASCIQTDECNDEKSK